MLRKRTSSAFGAVTGRVTKTRMQAMPHEVARSTNTIPVLERTAANNSSRKPRTDMTSSLTARGVKSIFPLGGNSPCSPNGSSIIFLNHGRVLKAGRSRRDKKTSKTHTATAAGIIEM